VAATAAAMSTILMIEPPCTLPIGLASLGSITWLIILRDSAMGLGAMGAGSPNSRLRKGRFCADILVHSLSCGNSRITFHVSPFTSQPYYCHPFAALFQAACFQALHKRVLA